MHDAGIAVRWCPLLATACFASVLLMRSVCVSYIFVYLLATACLAAVVCLTTLCYLFIISSDEIAGYIPITMRPVLVRY